MGRLIGGGGYFSGNGEEDWQQRYQQALHMMERGFPDLALVQLHLALELAPQENELHAALLQCLLLSEQSDTAYAHFEALQDLSPSPDLHYWQGQVCEALEQVEAAKEHYLHALKLSASFAPAHLQLARHSRQHQALHQALNFYRKYLQLCPQDWEVTLEFAELLVECGQPSEANQLYQEVYVHQPYRTEVLLKWLQNQVVQNPSEVVRVLITLAVQYPHLQSNLALHAASILKAAGEIEEARKSLDLALQDPALPEREAYELLREFLISPVPKSRAEIEAFAQRLSNCLDERLNALEQAEFTPLIASDYNNLLPYLRLWEGAGILAYFNVEPRASREKFGRLFQAFLPPLASLERTLLRSRRRDKPHLAFVINSNTAIQAFLLTVLYHWPQNEAEISILYTQPAQLQAQLSQARPDFHHLELSEDPAQALQQVREIQADLLFLTEVHTDRLLQSFLASYRLAPIQVTSWLSTGTTGLNTMDYFLSSQLLEQNEEPERFYSEKLLRLQHLPACIAPPLFQGPTPVRSEYGLPEHGHLYLCPHQMVKMHPDFDAVLGEILEQDPEGQLVLLVRPNIPAWQNRLLQRFEAAFPQLMSRIWFMPKMSHADFLGLLQLADVMLDPFYFGGGTTSFEALSLGVPIVTWPGERLHGRITYAYYRMLNFFETVAYTPEDYVERALQVATQPEWNQHLRQELRQRAGLLFDEREAVAELAQTLIGLVRGTGQES